MIVVPQPLTAIELHDAKLLGGTVDVDHGVQGRVLIWQEVREHSLVLPVNDVVHLSITICLETNVLHGIQDNINLN